MRPLDAATLRTPPPGLAVPSYDRRAVEVGVVHFGVGAFHRPTRPCTSTGSSRPATSPGGVCGVGVLPGDTAVRDALTGQDGLYTLLTVEPDGTEHARVVGSLVEVLHAPDDPDAVLARLVAPGPASCRSRSPRTATGSTTTPMPSCPTTNSPWPISRTRPDRRAASWVTSTGLCAPAATVGWPRSPCPISPLSDTGLPHHEPGPVRRGVAPSDCGAADLHHLVVSSQTVPSWTITVSLALRQETIAAPLLRTSSSS
jgi:Mannitol dehydrogenase Rossmann domain